MYLLKWTGPSPDGLIWYQRHERSAPGVRPRMFEATWVADIASAARFSTPEAAKEVANIWSSKHVEIVKEEQV